MQERGNAMNAREIRRQARELVSNNAPEVENEEFRTYDFEDSLEVRCTFVGTVFNVMPSGKYYMPWACSNVEPCNRCKGTGCDFCGHQGSREAFEDTLMIEALEEYAAKKGLAIESGEGDPCDLFLCEYRDTEPG